MKINTSYKWTQIPTTTGMINLHELNSSLIRTTLSTNLVCMKQFSTSPPEVDITPFTTDYGQQHLGEFSYTQ